MVSAGTASGRQYSTAPGAVRRSACQMRAGAASERSANAGDLNVADLDIRGITSATAAPLPRAQFAMQEGSLS